MYEPFEQAIDRYEETERVQPLEVFEERLTACDGCGFRDELRCLGCAGCGKRSLIRWAERLTTKCPRSKWGE